HPDAFVPTSLSSFAPDAPAVYVISFPSRRSAILPLTIDQAYVVAPAGPLAVLPVELAQTCAGVGVIVGVVGFALIVTLTVFVAGHPEAFVTTSGRSVVPEAPAVYVIVWRFVAEVS